jgi:DNA-binding NtrC family response regulator
MPIATILIVDDDEHVRAGLGHSLRRTEYRVLFAESADLAFEVLAQEPVDVVMSDHMMPGTTGAQFLKAVRDRFPDTIRIMLTGHASAETAIQAINQGEIYRLLAKPIDRAELLVTLHLACEKLELERENRRLLSLIRTHPELAARLEEEQRSRHARLAEPRA